MKKTIIFLFLMSAMYLSAQDVFQKELFSADVALKYRSEIKLSPKKVDLIKKIHKNNISEFNSVKWDLDAKLIDFKKHLTSTKVNEKTSLAQLKKSTDLEDRMKQIKLRMLIQIKNQLSESQQKQLKSLRTEKEMRRADLTIPISSNSKLTIRARATYTETSPLYVLKNKKGTSFITESSFKDINQDYIESIKVIKSSKLTKKYGEKGKNGVVIIQMKN